MSWISNFFLNEETKGFKNKGEGRVTDKQIQRESGEGIESMGMDMGITNLNSSDMIKTSIEKLANGIGFDIGMSDDKNILKQVPLLVYFLLSF